MTTTVSRMLKPEYLPFVLKNTGYHKDPELALSARGSVGAQLSERTESGKARSASDVKIGDAEKLSTTKDFRKEQCDVEDYNHFAQLNSGVDNSGDSLHSLKTLQ